jgi:2-methylcitrate dehydratase PrpD
MSRWLAIGNAARNGVAAALAAQAGFTGDLRLFEGEFFPRVYGISPDLDALAGALTQRPAVAQTSFKPWCAARQTMAAAQATRELVGEGVQPAEMSEVVVGVPPAYLKMVDHGTVSGDRTSFLTSVPYQMALAAIDPDATLDTTHMPEKLPEAISGFMAKISVKADEDLLRHYPESWPARLVELQVSAKFWRVTTRILGMRSAESLLRRCLAALDQAPGTLLSEIDAARSVV